MNEGNSNPSFSNKKRILWILFNVTAPILGLICFIILLSNSRTLELLRWTKPIIGVVVLIAVFSFGTPLFGAVDIIIAEKSKDNRKKLPSRGFWVIALIGVIAPASALSTLTILSTINSGNKAPQLMIISQTGAYGIPDMAVTYWTNTPENIEMSVGEDPGLLTESIPDEYSGSSKSHAFLLEDLEPNTQYFYKISTIDTIFNFTTMANSLDDLHFAVGSDIHIGASTNNPQVTEKILQYINNDANGFDALFVAGDMVEFGCIDGLWKKYSQLFSPHITHIPYRPLMGNHDGFFNGENLYLRYLYPDKIPSNTGSRLYYQIEIGDIHIFVLDLEWGIGTYSHAQKEWFETEIAVVPEDDWTIVINHAMYYTSG
ncbi:MAG: hypothetical protein GF364_04270, partial [Candidatus Lokiarchaeota archaeon]|nr:hypothetical protein [Candidatus Lokiarchaeota archaeon]